jgi:hypothetical protein
MAPGLLLTRSQESRVMRIQSVFLAVGCATAAACSSMGVEAEAQVFPSRTIFSNALAINETLSPTRRYDARRDLTPVAKLAELPFALIVTSALPVSGTPEAGRRSQRTWVSRRSN